MKKKVMVCGLGSMGRRRINILRSEFPDVLLIGVDNRQDRRATAAEAFGIPVEKEFEAAFQKHGPDIVFACTAPLAHRDIVLYALENGADTFSELNLDRKDYDRIQHTAAQNRCVAFLSSTFLYRKEIRWIIAQTAATKHPVSYRYHTGQYLPEWHPWESYTDFFVADMRTSAIREIMAIEFPWLFKAFGKIVDYKIMHQTVSPLALSYPDVVHMIFTHETGNIGSISFDCVCACPVRQLSVYTHEKYFQWGGTMDSLLSWDGKNKQLQSVSLQEQVIENAKYASFITENPYIEEVTDFFQIIEKRSRQTIYGYKEDDKVLDWIDRINKENG